MEFVNIHDYQDELNVLSECNICPHNCGINRFIAPSGWCRTGPGFYIASVAPHFGEEPIISGKKGICNVFFAHCNLQCAFCQNYQISDNMTDISLFEMRLDELILKIVSFLEKGCHAVGFVSPSHVVPQVKIIIKELRRQGHNCVFVYNSNGYDSVASLQSLEGLIDVYLPDMKYLDTEIPGPYSRVPDYSEIAVQAAKEMYRQKGSSLITDDQGRAISGLIIRHLVLPGNIENSKKVLQFIADELSPRIHISLMAQYYPSYRSVGHEILGRKLREQEYQEVVEELHHLGLQKGWIQDLDSPEFYLPDFDKENPF
ncbi:MAG: hypothetical protein AB9842_06800 [Bacteroidales bacterium]